MRTLPTFDLRSPGFPKALVQFASRYRSVILITIVWSLSLRWWEGELMWTSHSPGFEPARLMGVFNAWMGGIWDARWLPAFDQGYGYPIFSYHSPLFSWTGGALFAITSKPVLSLRLAVLVFFVVGGIGCRTLAADFWRREGRRDDDAGDTAFLAWASATYLLTNIFVRGSLAEFAGSCFVPWVLWALWLLTADARRYTTGGCVLAVSLALVVLSHNAIAVYTAMLIVPLALVLRPAGRQGWIAWAAGGFTAACLSAFFVVPAWAERSFVHLDSVAFPDVRDHFLRVDHLLAISQWNLGNSGQHPACTMPRHQGVLLPFVLISGLAAFALFQAKELRAKTARAMGLVAVTLLMAMSPSVWLWDHLRVLQYTQFPWRWLSLNAVALSLLAPAFAIALKLHSGEVAQISHRVALTAIFLLAIGLYGGPNALWHRWPYPPDMAAIRNDPTRTAVTDEYGPVWRPKEFNHTVPAGRARDDNGLLTPARKPNRRWRWHAPARPERTTVLMGVNYFPGWRAYWTPDDSVSRTELATTPADDGLISVVIPAGGPGHLDLRFTNTPIRLAMKLFSAFSLLAGVVIVIWIRWRAAHPRCATPSAPA